MILQVLSHAGQVIMHLDAVAREMRGRSDPRQHQELGRPDGACGENHIALGFDDDFASILDDDDALHTALLDDEPGDEGLRLDGKVWTMAHRLQIADRCAAAARMADRHLIDVHPFLVAAVEIGIEGHAEFLCAFDKSPGHDIGFLQRRDAERSALAMHLANEPIIVFRFHEIGQKRGP